MPVIDVAPPGGTTASAPTLLHLSGDIDIHTTTPLRQRLLNALASSTSLLVLDLSQVTFCGAGGLSVLVDVQSRARRQGISLALTGVPPRVIRLLHITGLTQRFPTVD
ncbi:STAS domain-containing protein [Nonomuraea sp. NPDC050643]|uniref:STAS domain-containing protein n=1 Tax=Nonomuraea sp. NPDC050643 TaxID=3155660 RepID=UPI0033F048FC